MSEISHPFPPVYNSESRILILGTFPSVKSRETAFYYGHPRNRFWKTLAAVFDAPIPTTVEEKTAFLHSHHIALWDTCAVCDIRGSADTTIRNVVPNDLSPILETADIRAVFCGGKTAYRLYKQYQYPKTGIEAVCLPSTSPANAAVKDAELVAAWAVIREWGYYFQRKTKATSSPLH